jgi:hypothetical protein
VVALLLLVTGLTGMAAALTNDRRVATCFLAVLLAAELALLVGVVNAQLSHMRAVAERDVEGDCADGARHAAFMTCLVVGVVFSSLTCCGAQLLRGIRAEEHVEMAKVNAGHLPPDANVVVVVVVPAVMTKLQPHGDVMETAVLID